MTARALAPRALGARRSSRWWLFVVLATLLAVSWQSVVTRAHAANTAAAAALATAHVERGASHLRGAPAHSPDDCPLCRDLAISGSYLPPSPIVLAPAPPFLLEAIATPPPNRARQERSHAWRSRGPPPPLQP